MKITFSNPRLHAAYDDWPIGGTARGKCAFNVLHDKRGWRIERVTQNKYGVWCKPKYSTYSGQAAIVDGSDGRTYILQVAAQYGFVKIMAHDFMDASETQIGRRASVFDREDAELHAQLLSIILAGGAITQPVA